MAQVNLSILKITGDENDYMITEAQSTANSKLKSAVLSSSYANNSKTLTITLSTSTE